jgi:hypothetical protein
MLDIIIDRSIHSRLSLGCLSRIVDLFDIYQREEKKVSLPTSEKYRKERERRRGQALTRCFDQNQECKLEGMSGNADE